jgi:hypothetical protein
MARCVNKESPSSQGESMSREVPPHLFEGLADFEVDFFLNLVKSYAKLDVGMRGFFFHRIKQVVKETIELLRAELERSANRELH